MKFISRYFWYIFLIVVLLTLIYQVPEVKKNPIQTYPNYYITENGKVAPLTILSEEDSKKPCQNCHKK